MKLYHYTLGFPKGFSSNVGTVQLTFTGHALHAALTDRYGRIVLPKSIDTREALCIEALIEGGQVGKLVYRTAYSKNYDLILVCIPKRGGFTVATVWLNDRQDSHQTLDASKYDRGA